MSQAVIARRAGVLAGIGVLVLIAGAPPRSAVATSTPGASGAVPLQFNVARVEEDWVLNLNEPGEAVNSPQFHTTMSPFGHVEGPYAQISWNYRELPDFVPGGLQLQAWKGELDLGQRDVREDALSRSAETLAWTQALETAGQHLRFVLKNGHSTSWGAFGGPDVAVNLPVAVPNLNGYCRAVSIENSWITYGANRVNSLKITAVRYYGADGTLLAEDNTPVVVYQPSNDD